MELSQRQKQILSLIVEAYVKNGEPVGSKLLSELLGNRYSTATLRNEMAELSSLGLLEQPHTSAGRIPTEQGYRFYVDQLMRQYQLTAEEKRQIDQKLNIKNGDLEEILEFAGNVLADMTHCMTLMALTDLDGVCIRRVDVILASQHSALIVVLTSSGLVKNRLAHVEGDLSPEHCQLFAKLANQNIADIPVGAITQFNLSAITTQFGFAALMFAPLVDALAEMIEEMNQSEIYVEGGPHLLSRYGLDYESAAGLLHFLSSRQAAELVWPDKRVVIGKENAYAPLQHTSLISSPYALQGKVTGTVSLIAPTRTDYARLISSVDYFSKKLEQLLKEFFGEY